jgi:bifunctional ADP-heptose synthase (sugar kinase/adenylyltransferase)
MKADSPHPDIERECHWFAQKTEADVVRNMTDEELAELLTAVAKKSAEKLCESLKTVDVDLSNCDFDILYKAHLDWLKQAAEEGE